MVAATQQQQQQATATVPSAEEEALKRNTDCVYFLASPLTCKKGSECEYRHSEYARVNPRDCYYWLNGNCLNPKCGFRHPPLDSLFGNQAATSAGPSLPPSQKVAPSAVHTPQNSGKQAVPCFYFQKGLCYKGDRCAFSHGPSSTSNKVSQPIVPLAGSELPPQTKAFAGPQKFTPVQKIPQANFAKAVEASADSKPASKPDIGSRRHAVGVERNLPPSKSMDDEVPKFKATNIQPVANGNSSRFNRLHHPQVPDDQNFQNGKDVDEFLRESSPGFDVLVDNELRNSDFYHGEDQYGSATGPEGINLNPVAEYDRGHSADYSSVADIDRETYRDLRGYDTYERMQGQYAWDQHRSSSERMPLGPAHMERRGYSRADSPEHVEDADLRYRLAKHRRVNGLRSVVSHDFVSDSHVEEKGYRSSSRRDSHNISSRLHGRIKLPGSSSNASDLRVERGIDNGRNRGRLSPGRSQISSHQVRLRDRIRARGEENHDSEGRSLRDSRVRRETADDRINFAPPKSLAELKGTKSTEGMPHQSLRKRKQLEDHQPSEGDLSFEGPMPLSEILKRKREAGSAASGSRSSFNKHDNNQKESKEGLLSSSNNAAVADIESGPSFVKDEANRQLLKNEEESKSITAVENTEVDDQREPDTEDGMIVDDGVEEGQEYEADDQREGDYEYEQGDGGEYYEEGENAEGEEEYVEEEDGDADADDFAKKIGVMFT